MIGMIIFMLYDKICGIMKEEIENETAAGVNILVLKNGEEKLYCQYGYRDIDDQKPMDRDTIMRMYSQTKPLTAAAAMILVSEGKIDLAADIAEYMPEFSEQNINTDGIRRNAVRRITVRDLLNMTSGYTYPEELSAGGRQTDSLFKNVNSLLYTDHPVTTAEFARMAADIDLCFEPGAKFKYGISADIIGALIERVSEMPFGEFMKKNLLEPLEMKDTDFYVPAEKQDRLAKVYDNCTSGLYELKTDHLGLRYDRAVKPAFESGGAGLCSTLDDYAHFASMLMNKGMYNGKRILPEMAVRFMTHGGLTPQQMPQLQEHWDWMSGYTYGNFMRVCENESQTSIFSCKGEYGWDGWLGTFFSNEPQSGITMLLGVQQAALGNTKTYTLKMKNIIMSELM